MTAPATPGSWSVCRYLRVRSAGFPYSLLEPLRLTETIIALERLEAERAALSPLADEVRAVLDAHPRSRKSRVASRRKRFLRALELGVPTSEATSEVDPSEPVAWRELELRWNAAASALDGTRASVQEQFEIEMERARRHLWQLVTKEQLRDALYFSSPAAADALRDNVPAGPLPSRSSSVRKLELTAMMFVQRFCAKNDSISYYGPIYWGEYRLDSSRSLDVVHGTGLISKRLYSMEYWAAVALAHALSADPEVHRFLVPRLRPGYRLESDGKAFRADGSPLELPAIERELLAELASDRPTAELTEDPARADALRRLESRGLIEVMPSVPASRASERAVVAAIDALPASCTARERWKQAVDDLRDKIASFVSVPFHDHEGRRHGFREMEATFERVTGAAPRRGGGEMYVGRSIIYEDCERAFDRFQVGGELARDLEGFGPLLDLAGWTMRSYGSKEHARYLTAHRALSRRHGGAVPLMWLYEAARTSGSMLAEFTAKKVQETIEQAFAGYLDERDPAWRSRSEVTIPSDALAAVLARLPPAPDLPECGVRVQSPDLMIAAGSVAEIERGDYRIVMGELHKGVFITAIPWARDFQPDADAVEAEFRRWCGKHSLMDLAPPDGNRSSANWPDVPEHLQAVHDGGCPTVSADRRVRIADLEVVEGEDGWLWVRRRGRPDERFFFLEVVRRDYLHALLGIDPVALPGDVTPRLSWGRVVLLRRRWRLRPSEFPAYAEPGLPLLIAARQWAASLGLPRQVFLRVAHELKPLLIDFANPFCVEILARHLRRAERAAVSEMYPGPDDLWLSDEHGTERYTCELRFTMYRSKDTAEAK